LVKRQLGGIEESTPEVARYQIKGDMERISPWDFFYWPRQSTVSKNLQGLVSSYHVYA
jgi:hypothetical protein